MIGLADLIEGFYFLAIQASPSTKPQPVIATSQASSQSSSFLPQEALWHFRLGHLSNHRLISLKQYFPCIKIDENSVCDICHYYGHRKSPFQLSVNKANNCCEMFHFDIWGLVSIQSIHSHRYFITALDDYSHFTWIILCKSKSEVQNHVQNFIIMIENQFNCKVKTVRTDNGPEFLMPDIYSSKGIEYQTSCVETPQQNGRVERKHQHILNVARALLFQSKLPKQFWSYSVLHAVYIINRIPTLLLQKKSPYFLRFGHNPDLNDFKVFDCLCYASTLQNHKTKFDSRAKKSLFLGYKQGVKGAILFYLNTKTIFVSRHVTYHEHILPYSNHSQPFQWQYHSNHLVTSVIELESINNPNINQYQPDITKATNLEIYEPEIPSNIELDNHNQPPAQSLPELDSLSLRRSTRTIQKPTHLLEYVCNFSKELANSSSSGILYPINHFHSLNILAP